MQFLSAENEEELDMLNQAEIPMTYKVVQNRGLLFLKRSPVFLFPIFKHMGKLFCNVCHIFNTFKNVIGGKAV